MDKVIIVLTLKLSTTSFIMGNHVDCIPKEGRRETTYWSLSNKKRETEEAS